MFLEHFTGFPALPRSLGRSADPLLDPLVLGVLTTALEDESADAYQQGFRDGLRAAALKPSDLDRAEAAGPDASDLGDPASGDTAFGQGDWHR